MKLSEGEVEGLISLLSVTPNLDLVLCALLERLSQEVQHSEAPVDSTEGNCLQEEHTFISSDTQLAGALCIC